MDSNKSEVNCRPAADRMTSILLLYCFQGLYGFSSIALYIMNIKALRYYKKSLDKSFSMFYICSAVLSIVYFLDYYLIRRFLKLGYFCESILEVFAEPTYLMNPYKTISSYCPIAILVFHSLIAAHRFSIVVIPIRGVQTWEHYRKPITIVGLLIPLIFMWFMIPTKSFAELDEEGEGLDIEYKKVFNLSSSLFAFIAALFFGLLTLFLTLGMLLVLSKKNFRKMSSAEISLIVFEILMTIFTMVYATVEGLVYHFNYISKNDEMEAQVKWVKQTFAIDIFILPQAWTLLFLSKTVRRYTLRFVGNRIGIEVTSSNFDKTKQVTRVPSSYRPPSAR